MTPLVLATQNPHKVAELRGIFAALDIPIVGLGDLPGGADLPEPAETGSTFLDNAAIKALAYARATGRRCIADDSGLEIDALGGRPGVISSHYATDGVETGRSRADRDAANNARVLSELGARPDRDGRFVCVMVLAAPPTRFSPNGQVLATARGVLAGRIGVPPDVPRGDNGFGYDPIFILPPPEIRTSAELSPEEKNQRSHRAAAAREMAERIRRLPY